jgi:hypothetical protein
MKPFYSCDLWLPGLSLIIGKWYYAMLHAKNMPDSTRFFLTDSSRRLSATYLKPVVQLTLFYLNKICIFPQVPSILLVYWITLLVK